MSKKSVVEIGRRAINPSYSSSGELALCTESEIDGQRAMRLNLMLNVYTRQDISLKTMTRQKHLIWAHITCVNYLSRAFVCGRLRKERHLFTVTPKIVYCGLQTCLLWPPNLFNVGSNLFIVAPKLVYCSSKTCLLWPQNLFTVAPKLVYSGPQICYENFIVKFSYINWLLFVFLIFLPLNVRSLQYSTFLHTEWCHKLVSFVMNVVPLSFILHKI
jgi:hypothetical protein